MTRTSKSLKPSSIHQSEGRPKGSKYSGAFTEGALKKRIPQNPPEICAHKLIYKRLNNDLLQKVEEAIKQNLCDQTNESFKQFCIELKELDQLFSKHYQSHLNSKMITFYNFSKTINYMLKDYPNLKKTVLDGEVTIMWGSKEYKTNPVKQEFWAS